MSEPLNTDILNLDKSTQSVDNIISNPLLDLTDITTDTTDYNPAKSKSLIQDIVLESREKQKQAVEKVKLTRLQSDLLKPLSKENPFDFLPMSEDKGKISLTGNEINPDLMYKELNSGKLIPKYDSFTFGVNNEDYAYGTQDTTDRWVNGVGKLLGKTAVNIVAGTVGTVYGIKEAIATGTFDAIYNNDFTNYLDDLNTRMDYSLPNYKSTYEKNMSFLRSMTTANFWADDVFSGISFTLGAIGTELVWAGLTGGASIVGEVGRSWLKLGAKSALKGLGKQAEKSFAKNTIDVFKQYLRTVPKSKLAGGLNSARFLYTSAGFEAGVESRQAFNESLDNFVRSYEKTYNRKPNGAEMSNFLDSAVNASNMVFVTNVGIVGGSNILQFGSYFGIGGGLTKAIDKSIGRMFGAGIKKEMIDGGKGFVMKSLKQSSRQKVLSNIWSVLESPVVEGVYEEGLQGVTSTAAKNWLAAKYDPDSFKTNYNLISAVRDGFAHTYGTSEGFKEIGIGMIIGLFGSGMKKSEATGKRTPFNIGQYTELSKSYDKVADEYNKFTGHITEAQQKLLDRLVNTNQFTHFINKSKQEAEKGNIAQATTDFDIAQFTKMMIDDKADMLDDSVMDFETVLENTDDDVIKEKYKLSDDEISAFKSTLLDTYKQNVELYKKSQRIAESISPSSKYTPRKDYKHELALNVYLGYKSGKRASEIADQINQIIGTGGVGSALRLYTNLNKRAKRAGKRLVALEQEIENLEKEYAQLQTSFTSTKVDKTERVKENKEVGRKLDKTYEKAQKALEKIEKKRAELDELQKKIDGRFYYRDFNFGAELFDEGKGLYVTEQELKDSIKELEKLDKYIKTLRQENPKVADALDSLLNEYQMNVIAFRDYNKVYEEMSDVRFMQKESKGVWKLFSNIGEKLDKITQKDDPVFGESSRTVEEIIEKNPNMSEEDKFTLRTLNKLVTAFQLQKRLPNLDTDVQDKIDTIDKEAFDKIMDSGELPQSLNDNIANKIINGEKLTPREQEIYNTFKDEIDKNTEEIRFKKGDSLNKVRRKLIKPDKSIDNLTKRLENLIDQIKNRNHYLTNLDYQNYKKEDIPTEKEYNEFEKLTKKKMNGQLTPRQRTRYNNLKVKINNWGKLEGAISGRATLSDIIEQLIYLKENSSITNDVLGSLQNLDDIVDIEDLRPTSNNSNYDHLQTYDQAFVSKSDSGEEYRISNISLKGLLNIIAGAGHTVKIERKGKVKDLSKLKTKIGETYIVTINNDTKVLFKINDRGNLVVTKEGKNKLNQSTNIKIMPNTLSLSKYSSLLQEVKVGDEIRLETVPTDFEFSQDMNMESVWGLKPNDTLYLEADTSDPYNKQLLRKYKNAKTDEEKNKALEELNAGLVIYVKDKNNNLVGVYKSSFSKATTKDNDNLTKLKEIRNFAVGKVLNENFMENQVIDLGMSVKVDKVYVGHPKISLKKDENGKVFVVNNRITDQDTKHIVDIGYVQNGKIELKNKEQGVEMFPFMTKLQRDSKYKGKKIPFAVLNFKGRKIAYPVNLISTQLDLSGEFLSVYNNDALERQEKILKLNDIIKYGGLDINTFGITFDNLNSKNISLVAKELSNIDQLPDVTQWINGNMSIEDILKEQVEINLNLGGDIFHSPKIVTKILNVNIPQSYESALFENDVEIDTETGDEIKQQQNQKC